MKSTRQIRREIQRSRRKKAYIVECPDCGAWIEIDEYDVLIEMDSGNMVMSVPRKFISKKNDFCALFD